ncbi:MAG: hypothetical protein H7839_12175 [Magnetococcus sp. YQC-5]
MEKRACRFRIFVTDFLVWFLISDLREHKPLGGMFFEKSSWVLETLKKRRLAMCEEGVPPADNSDRVLKNAVPDLYDALCELWQKGMPSATSCPKISAITGRSSLALDVINLIKGYADVSGRVNVWKMFHDYSTELQIELEGVASVLKSHEEESITGMHARETTLSIRDKIQDLTMRIEMRMKNNLFSFLVYNADIDYTPEGSRTGTHAKAFNRIRDFIAQYHYYTTDPQRIQYSELRDMLRHFRNFIKHSLVYANGSLLDETGQLVALSQKMRDNLLKHAL